MSLPGNRVPEGEKLPVWDVTGTRWSWVEERAHYVCDDPDYAGEEVTEPGAIPRDRQPVYTHPPTPFELALVAETEEP